MRARELLGSDSKWVSKGEAIQRQAIAALKTAEAMWQETMSLFQVDAPETIGGQKLALAARDQEL